MLGLVLIMLAAGDASDPAPRVCEATVVEATFAPLLRSERSAARFGPAGPFYPQAAGSRNGEALLQCEIGAGGALKDCKVLSERPERANFGVAARIMSERRRIRAHVPDAVGACRVVRVPFVRGAPVEIER